MDIVFWLIGIFLILGISTECVVPYILHKREMKRMRIAHARTMQVLYSKHRDLKQKYELLDRVRIKLANSEDQFLRCNALIQLENTTVHAKNVYIDEVSCDLMVIDQDSKRHYMERFTKESVETIVSSINA